MRSSGATIVSRIDAADYGLLLLSIRYFSRPFIREHNQALCRSSLGDDDGALPLITEAVALRRQLVEAEGGDPAELAESLNNLADTLHDLGDDDDAAREPAEEAVAICADPANGCSDDLYRAARATLEALDE